MHRITRLKVEWQGQNENMPPYVVQVEVHNRFCATVVLMEIAVEGKSIKCLTRLDDSRSYVNKKKLEFILWKKKKNGSFSLLENCEMLLNSTFTFY